MPGRNSPALGAALALLLAAATAQAAPTTVAVMDLVFQGEIPPWMSEKLRQNLEQGLAATGLSMLPAAQITEALSGSAGSCATSACRKALGEKLKSDYLVGGDIKGEARSYQFRLWIARADTGELLATIKESCDICGQAKVFARMELVASRLSARMASKQEQKRPARLLLRSDPPGGDITVDGEAAGTTPRTLTLSPGKHQIMVSTPGHIPASLEFEAVSGVDEQRRVALIPKATPGANWRVLGWTSLGAGVAALAAGVVLLVLDGSETECSGSESPVGPTSQPCPSVYETLAGGAALTGVGAAALGAAGYLLYRAYRDDAPAREQAAVRFTGGGIAGRF